MDSCWPQAHRAGGVSTAQADVIARALDDLPDETPPDVVATAERVLVEHAATFAPKELRVLGGRILDVVAPEVGEEQERKRLEGEERKARRTTSLTTRSHGDGSTTIRIRVPDATADRLLTYLHAWTNPRKHDAASRRGAGTDAGRRCRTRPASVTRSAPCWSTSTPPSCPATAGPPRPWSSRWTTTR